MSKVAVVYWTGTGNTQTMAESVAEGARNAGADVDFVEVSSFDPSSLGDYDAIAFGCPSMGVEVLEETEFQPVYDECKPGLSGKKVAIFGSYGWGDGEWMRIWEEEIQGLGANLVAAGVMCNYTPEESGLNDCVVLGETLAK